MTRQELNLAIATLAYPVEKGYHHWVDSDGCAIAESDTEYEWFDLKLWETLMPLIIEHDIELMLHLEDENTWIANNIEHLFKSDSIIQDKDPQVALAKCLLAVLKEKNKC